MKSHKVLILGILVSVVIIIVAGVVWYLLRSPVLTLTTSPSNATVTLDDKPITLASTKISSGTHQLKATADGFVPYAKTIQAGHGQKVSLQILLKPIPSPITLSSDVQIDPIFAKNGEVFFLGNHGKTLFHTLNNNGQAAVQIQAITPDTLTQVSQVIWRPDAQVALLKRPDGIYLYDFARYDLLHQTMTLWGTGIDAIAWDPSGIRVAYTFYGANGEQSLKFSDIQNGNVTIVANLAKANIDHPDIQWSPDSQSMLLIPRSPQKKTNYMYTLDVFSKSITQLTSAGQVQGGTWSPDSTHIAYVAPGKDTNGRDTLILWVALANGSGVTPLNIPVSDIGKVAWTNDSKSLVISENTDNGQMLVQVTLDNQIIPYAYTKGSDQFDPQDMTTVLGDDRILYFNQGKFVTLSLISTKYN